MKQILLLTILVLVYCLQGFGQENIGCPKLGVAMTGKEGSTLFYVSSVGIFDNSKFEYKWTVSNGVNFNGQGTSVISISENMEGQEITATVEIKGLLENCKNNYSEVFEIVPPRLPIVCVIPDIITPDSSWQEYLSRIQNLALAVQGEKGSKGVIIFKFTNLSEQKKSVAMKNKILRISKIRKISLDGIEMKIQKGKVYETTFEFAPKPTN